MLEEISPLIFKLGVLEFEKQFSPSPILFLISTPSSIYQFLRIELHTNSRPFLRSSNPPTPSILHVATALSSIRRSLSVAKKTGWKRMERSRVAAEHIVHVASSVSNNFSPLDRSTKSPSPPLLIPYLSSIWFVPGLVETSFTVQDSKMHSPSWPISFLTFLPSRGSPSLSLSSNFHLIPYFFEEGNFCNTLHILIKRFPSLIDLPRYARDG